MLADHHQIPVSNSHTVGNELEALPPEHYTLLEIQSDPLEEKCILQPPKMLEVIVLPQLAMEVLHAQWKVLT